MHDALVYGYDLCTTYMQQNPKEKNRKIILKETQEAINPDMVEDLIYYCGASRENILEAIIEGINRCITDLYN